MAYIVYNGTAANCAVAGMDFTDISYSSSTVPILYDWCGTTLLRTSGIYIVHPDDYPVIFNVLSGVSYAGGALTGTASGGGVSNDIIGLI